MAISDWLKKGAKRGRPRHEPQRETIAFPTLQSLLGPEQKDRLVYKPTPRNVRVFSRTPICRRAINAIKNPIAMLEWEIAPIKGVDENSEIKRQVEVATAGLENPNDDDTFMDLISQLVEDYCCGAGAVEIGRSGDELRPIWLWPVDGLTIQIYPAWTGAKNEARYFQTVGYGGLSVGQPKGVPLRNDELIYVRPNISTASPFGYGPVEVAFETIARQLNTGRFAGKVASNALPPFMLDLGEVSGNVLQAWRSYWRHEVEGQGQIPIIGTEMLDAANSNKTRGASAIRLYPEGDTALYLGYQEYLRTEIAAAFDISNSALNMERDVNRSTAEVMEDRDWDNAIKPCAKVIAGHINRDVIRSGLGFSQVQFRWLSLDREDEESTSRIMQTYYDINVFTPNEIREKLGEPKAENVWGDMTRADAEVAVAAARNAGIIDDPDLTSGQDPLVQRQERNKAQQQANKTVRDANVAAPSNASKPK